MADNINVTSGSGNTVAFDEVADGTLGTCKVQYVKLMDGTLDGTAKLSVSTAGIPITCGTAANFLSTISNSSGTALFIQQGTASNLFATVVATSGTALFIQQGTAANLLATVIASSGSALFIQQGTSSNLKVELGAGSALVGKTIAHAESGSIYVGTVAYTPTFTAVDIAASQTDSVVVASAANTQYRVVALVAMAGTAATNVAFNTKGTGAGTLISMTFRNAANGGEVLPYCPVGLFQTSVGHALTATTGAGGSTGVMLTYIAITS